MQKAVKKFLKTTEILSTNSVDDASMVVLDFWSAIAAVLEEEWADPRRHMLTKGIGVYALMMIAADIFSECRSGQRTCDRRAFVTALTDFAGSVDWSTSGPP